MSPSLTPGMSPSAWFAVANPFALLGWLLLLGALFAPARGAWRPRLLMLAGRVWPLVLAAGYAAALLAHWGSVPGGGFGTLEQVAALFASPGNLLAGWVHYLAFDLFIGSWAVADAQARGLQGARRWLMVPVLALIFMFGPVGLLLYFAVRPRAAALELNHVR
jgi:Domain of unknown function (DUF4281)